MKKLFYVLCLLGLAINGNSQEYEFDRFWEIINDEDSITYFDHPMKVIIDNGEVIWRQQGSKDTRFDIVALYHIGQPKYPVIMMHCDELEWYCKMHLFLPGYIECAIYHTSGPPSYFTLQNTDELKGWEIVFGYSDAISE